MRRGVARRTVLRGLVASGAITAIDPGVVLARLAAQQPCDPAADGELLGTLPLGRAGAQRQPYGVKFGGTGLDARLVTDLSLLRPDRLITSNALAYIRTECPPAVAAHRGPWTIKTPHGALSLDDLARAARPMGAHLFECSGNNNPSNFGLMSVAEWDGVPLTEVFSRLTGPSGSAGGATAVFVGGVDHDRQRSKNSVAGASWIFPLASLERVGAFLAVRMNGEPLPLDHGWPVRLVVPRWYGCAWIKWVSEIRLVGAGEPATSQMIEFAGRTHQAARHALARDYSAPEIQSAAMPVRIEKRRTAAGLEYRIVGIVWGGASPVEQLAIRFGPRDAWKPFEICPKPATNGIWSLWAYTWIPVMTGLYDITLRLADPAIPQRRLDFGHYMRQVNIDEV